MRMNTKSAFALASVLTLTLAACAGDEDDVAGDEEEEGETSEVDDTDTTDGGDDDADAGEPAGEITSVDEIVIGLVPATDSATAAEEEYADALAEQLSESLGGFPVDIFFAEDYIGVVQAMSFGDVQLLMSGPIGLIQAEEEAGGVPILQSVRYGSDMYVTQWFTNDPDTYCVDGDPEDIDGFLFCNGITPESEPGPLGEAALEVIEDGTSVAYVDNNSASGYYFPQTQLNELGIEVDGQFAGGHDNAVLAVYNGNYPIGTSFDDARGNVTDEAPDVGEEVVVFAWAGPIPNDGVVASGDFTDEERQLISEAFLSFGETVDTGEEDEEGDYVPGTGDPLYDVYEIEGLVPADVEALDLAREVYHAFGDSE